MPPFNVLITLESVGKVHRVKSVGKAQPPPGMPPKSQPRPGDDVDWVVRGPQGNDILVIGRFKKTTGAATCPFDNPYYGVWPGQGDVVGHVSKTAVKGRYKYKVKLVTPAAIGRTARSHWLPTPTMADGGTEMLGSEILVVGSMECQVDPEIQIAGGT